MSTSTGGSTLSLAQQQSLLPRNNNINHLNMHGTQNINSSVIGNTNGNGSEHDPHVEFLASADYLSARPVIEKVKRALDINVEGSKVRERNTVRRRGKRSFLKDIRNIISSILI